MSTQTSIADDSDHLTSTVFRLAGPVLVERVSVSVLGAVDALIVGHYVGGDAVAAVGISGLLFWIPLAGAFGLDIATTAVIRPRRRRLARGQSYR